MHRVADAEWGVNQPNCIRCDWGLSDAKYISAHQANDPHDTTSSSHTTQSNPGEHWSEYQTCPLKLPEEHVQESAYTENEDPATNFDRASLHMLQDKVTFGGSSKDNREDILEDTKQIVGTNIKLLPHEQDFKKFFDLQNTHSSHDSLHKQKEQQQKAREQQEKQRAKEEKKQQQQREKLEHKQQKQQEKLQHQLEKKHQKELQKQQKLEEQHQKQQEKQQKLEKQQQIKEEEQLKKQQRKQQVSGKTIPDDDIANENNPDKKVQRPQQTSTHQPSLGSVDSTSYHTPTTPLKHSIALHQNKTPHTFRSPQHSSISSHSTPTACSLRTSSSGHCVEHDNSSVGEPQQRRVVSHPLPHRASSKVLPPPMGVKTTFNKSNRCVG